VTRDRARRLDLSADLVADDGTVLDAAASRFRALREEAASVTPESRAVSWTGTPAIDVAGGVVAQLHDLHVDISWVAGCAREDLRLFSHRRDGVTGRFGGFIVRKAP
jgi:copper oxidase (laccase) domain-containing protein